VNEGEEGSTLLSECSTDIFRILLILFEVKQAQQQQQPQGQGQGQGLKQDQEEDGISTTKLSAMMLIPKKKLVQLVLQLLLRRI